MPPLTQLLLHCQLLQTALSSNWTQACSSTTALLRCCLHTAAAAAGAALRELLFCQRLQTALFKFLDPGLFIYATVLLCRCPLNAAAAPDAALTQLLLL
jgi:hypothetical protein